MSEAHKPGDRTCSWPLFQMMHGRRSLGFNRFRWCGSVTIRKSLPRAPIRVSLRLEGMRRKGMKRKAKP